MDDVLAFIASVLQVNPADLSEDDGTDTVPEWNSLKVLLIASLIEIDHGVTLDEADIARLTTVREVREVIARYSEKQAGAAPL